jgi:hypothetical protein
VGAGKFGIQREKDGGTIGLEGGEIPGKFVKDGFYIGKFAGIDACLAGSRDIRKRRKK